MKKKYYTDKEIEEKFRNKSESAKIKILEKSLKYSIEYGGSRIHCIASAMGYVYSDMYNVSTWTK